MSLSKEEVGGFKLKEKLVTKKAPSSDKIRPYVHWDGPKPTPDQFKEYTLVVATISVANIGQLTADLLRANLKESAQAVRMGYFVCPKTLVAIAGEFGEENGMDTGTGNITLVSSCEIYVSEEEKLMILQHRGVIARGRKSKFVKYVMNFIKYLNIEKLLVLSSCFASQRTDREINLGRRCLYYAKSSGVNPSRNWDVTGNVHWVECKDVDNIKGERTFPNLDKFKGSGIASLLFAACWQNQVANLTIFLYTSDGENQDDAVVLFIEANKLLKIVPQVVPFAIQPNFPADWKMHSTPLPNIY